MTNITKYLFVIFSVTTTLVCSAQSKIIKVTYTSSPVSQYQMTESDLRSTPTKASLYTFMQGITDYYSLYIDVDNRSSLYTLDSTVQIRPIGWEDPKTTAALSDIVHFTLKSVDNKTYKHEWILNQTFFSEGQVGDIKWELINEKRTINGLQCHKAISTNYPLLTVWYTKDIPVSNGPSIYQGLPGLVVWAEDYFRTIEISKISYDEDKNFFNQLYDKKLKTFSQEKENKKYYDKEPIVIVKKGDLALGTYEYFHKKSYKK